MRAGERVGPYVVVSELGRGGMGLVLRARHAATGAEVALKVLDASLVDAEAVTRFDLEGKALARVAGDGVVPVHAAGLDGRQRWIALGLMEGGSLRDRMKKGGPWPWERAVELVRGLAATLGRCHAAGIVHRDLKPENILFDAAGRAHVADFGLVRDLAAQALTRTGTVLGTPAYMAPEQLEGLRVDARADVWALGVILHELVAGERPWVGKQTVQLLARITATPRPRLAERGAPPDLDAVLDRALTLDAEGRYPDAGALAGELGRVLAREAPAALLAQRARHRRRRQLGLLVLAALVVLLGAALQEVGRRRSRLLALTQALGDDAARIDSWRGGLRAARCADEPPGLAREALEAAVRTGEERLRDPEATAAPVAFARARVAVARGRLELSVARGAAEEGRAAGASLGGLSVPLAEDAHLRLLAELAAKAPAPSVVKRELGLVLNLVATATGEQGIDLRLAAARGHAALGDLPDAIALLARSEAPSELRLRARCVGLMSNDRSELSRLLFDRVAPTAAGGEELGAAALDGFVTRLAGAADADLRRLVQLAWDLELEYREAWRRLDPAAATRWPGPEEWHPFHPPARPARPPRTLLRPVHAPALRAALERLDGAADDQTTPVAARCSELLAVADQAAPAPERTWARVHALFERHTAEIHRLQGADRAGMARQICHDLADRLRLGLSSNAGAIPEVLRKPLRRAANELVSDDDRDWAREALLCALELHDRRNFFDLLPDGQESRERERATLRRPLERLAASPLLSPAARAAVALEVAEYGLAHVGDVDESRWLEAPTSPERRARLVEARALLEAHRPASTAPDQFDCVLAQVVFVLGEPAEAERLARRALALTALRDARRPLEGRPAAPKTAFQHTPITLRRVLARALRAQGRTAEAEEVESRDDTLRPR